VSYAVYHGPDGLDAIASRVHALAAATQRALTDAGVEVNGGGDGTFFDTLKVTVADSAAVEAAGHARAMNVRVIDATTVGVSFGEAVTVAHVVDLLGAFGVTVDEAKLHALAGETVAAPAPFTARTSEFLTHPVFNTHKTESQMLRYLKVIRWAMRSVLRSIGGSIALIFGLILDDGLRRRCSGGTTTTTISRHLAALLGSFYSRRRSGGRGVLGEPDDRTESIHERRDPFAFHTAPPPPPPPPHAATPPTHHSHRRRRPHHPPSAPPPPPQLLESKDLSLNHSMISLGSCTMKLNATSEMIPVTWPEICNMHPFAPPNQTQGYTAMMAGLNDDLARITGFAAVSAQPNSGATGEYAGLLAIARYHKVQRVCVACVVWYVCVSSRLSLFLRFE
jgi:hypothetical protein